MSIVYILAAAVLVFCSIAVVVHFSQKGPKGPTGDAGATGATGSSSEKGPTGDTGDPGKQGPPGPKGATGDPGSNGVYSPDKGVYQPSSALPWSPGKNDTDITAYLATQDVTKSYNLVVNQGTGVKRTFNLSRAAFLSEGYMFTICNNTPSSKDYDGSFYIVPTTADPTKPAVAGAWDTPPDCSELKNATIPQRVTVPANGCVMAMVTKGYSEGGNGACPSNSQCSGGSVSCVERDFWYLTFVTTENTVERKCGTYVDSTGNTIKCPS